MITNFELFEYINYFEWLAHKFNAYLKSQDKDRLDVSKGQGRILGVLLVEDSLSTRALSSRTGLNISSLNEMLAKMEKKGLIVRVPLESDKRVIVNCLTDKARENIPKIDVSFFDCLNMKQKEEMLSIFKELNQHLEERISDLGDPNLASCCQHRKQAFEFFINR